MKKCIVLVGLCLFLTSCTASQVPMVLTTVTEGGDVIEVVSDKTSEASVEKERIVHKTLQVSMTEYTKQHKNSGLNIKFKMQELTLSDGTKVFIQTMDQLSFKEAPEIRRDLPKEPSVHPVWAVADSIGTTLIKSILIGYGVHEFAGMMTNLKTGGTYYGDYSPINSHTAGTPQGFNYSYAPITGQ